MQNDSAAAHAARLTYLTFAALLGVWIGAWLLKIRLGKVYAWLSGGWGSFLYWTTAKLVIWIGPAVWLLKWSGRTLVEVFNLPNWRGWLLWGGGVGLAVASTGIIPNYLQGRAVLPSQLDFGLVNVLIIAPIFEELLMRGAVQGNLERHYPFWAANVITSLLFVLLHVPGWYFMGVLWDNLTRPAGGALSIFLVSLAFGFAAQRSRSVMGGVLAHFLNNLF